MKSNVIVWIDDDKELLSQQRKALENRGYEVHQFVDVDAAIDFLKAKSDGILGVIVDVMMSPGRILRDRVDDGGLTTGLALVHYCLDQKLLKVDSSPRAIIFSYRADPMAAENMQKLGVGYFQKQDFMGRAICDLVSEQFKHEGDEDG